MKNARLLLPLILLTLLAWLPGAHPQIKLPAPSVALASNDTGPAFAPWLEQPYLTRDPQNKSAAAAPETSLLQRAGQPVSAVPDSIALLAPADTFIHADRAQLTLQGQPVILKGVNYYPQWHPWSEMWRQWDGPQIDRELRQARDQLGTNAVRLMLPYNYTGKRNDEGKIPPVLIARLHELAQIAGSLDMRLLITLFDFSHDFPAAGSAAEARQISYLRELVPQFAGDDRIFAWDLHNEPDHYETWRDGNSQAVLSWLGRMADLVHSLAPRQLVTVGMGQAGNLWLPGPDRRRVVDYSDVISMHSYDAGTIDRELANLRARTAKPIIVEEFGWPTGPACVANYTEATQVDVYRIALEAAKTNASSVFAWSLRDYDSPRTVRWDSREEYFGLYRGDGSLKPAARELAAFQVLGLPSTTVSNLPLSTIHPAFPDDPRAPRLISGSGHYVKGEFRRAWELFDGASSLGLPLTEAFKRPADGVIVQYFEAGALEYRPKQAGDPKTTPEIEQLARILQPLALGESYAAEHNLPRDESAPKAPFLDFYKRINGAWRLGRAITAEMIEMIGDTPTRVQYFQYGRLELNPTSGAVTASPLGKWAWQAECARP